MKVWKFEIKLPAVSNNAYHIESETETSLIFASYFLYLSVEKSSTIGKKTVSVK